MTLAELRKSRELWRARELYRYGKWQFYKNSSKRPSDERMALRTKWFDLYTEAHDERVKRDREIKVAQAAARAVTRTSDAGLNMIARFEGSIPYAYNDPLRYATFGVGHLLHTSPVTVADQAAWGSKAHPKPERVMPVFREDIKKYESAVAKALTKPASQKQFDAMVSLAFNIGTGGFAGSSVVKRHNAGDRDGAANAFLMWDNPSMLRPRREKERALYLGGNYPA